MFITFEHIRQEYEASDSLFHMKVQEWLLRYGLKSWQNIIQIHENIVFCIHFGVKPAERFA